MKTGKKFISIILMSLMLCMAFSAVIFAQAEIVTEDNIISVVSVKRVEPYGIEEFNFEITLDKKIGTGNTDYMRAINNTSPVTENYIEQSFANDVTINGVKIKDHDVPNVRRSSIRLLERDGKTVIELGISGHSNGYTDPFKLDGTDKLILTSNFKTYVGTSNNSNYATAYTFGKDIEIMYNNLANRWGTYGGECEISNFAQHNSTSNLFNIYFGDKAVYGNESTGAETDGDMFRATFNNNVAVGKEFISLGLRDYVLVNGKSLTQWDISGVRRSGLNYTKIADKITYATLEICGAVGDNANPLDFTKENTITFKKGFKTDPNPHTSLYWELKEDVTYEYSPFTKEWGIYRGEFNITSIKKTTDKDNADYNFDVKFDREIFNSGTVDGYGNSAYYFTGLYANETIETTKLNLGLSDYVEVNGNLLGEYDVLVDDNLSDSIEPRRRSYIQFKKSSNNGDFADLKIPGEGQNILKYDGTDKITFKKGFVTSPNLTIDGAQSYYKLSSDISFIYNVITDMWVLDNELKVNGVRRSTDGTFSIYQVVFDKPVFPTIEGQFNEGDTIFSTKTEAQSLEVRSLRNFVRVNGKLIKDIPNLAEQNGEIPAAAFIRFRGLNNGESVVEIGIRIIMDEGNNILKMDGKDTFEILSGFNTMFPCSGITKTDSAKYVYVPGYDYLVKKESGESIYNPSTINITGIENGGSDDVWYNLHVKFDKNPTLNGIGSLENEKFKEVFGNKIKFNGKTMESLRALSTVEKSLVSAHFVEMGDTKQFYLSIYVRKEAVIIPNMDEKNPLEIEFSKGLRTYLFDELNETKTYIYNVTYGIGVEKLANAPVYDDVRITNISGIIPEFHEGKELNRKIVINFDKAVVQRFLPHINADPSWIMGTPIGSIYGYTYNELGKYAVYGVLESIREYIVINGKTLAQLMTANADYMTGVKAHYGGSNNLSSLELWFSTDQNSALDYKTSYTIEIKKGFVTPMGGKTSEDTKFVYNTQDNKCYRNELPSGNDNEFVSKDENWNLSNLPLILGIVLPACAVVIAGTIVLVVIYKKKRGDRK